MLDGRTISLVAAQIHVAGLTFAALSRHYVTAIESHEQMFIELERREGEHLVICRVCNDECNSGMEESK